MDYNRPTKQREMKKMEIIGRIKELNGEAFPSIKTLIHSEIPQKTRVLRYLKTAEIVSVSPGVMTDVLTGNRTDIQLRCYSDGQFFWRSDVPYYVEKYDMALPEHFIEHILSQKTKADSYN